MEAAESEGRQRPTMRETLSLVGHGLGGRLNVRSGIFLSALGLAAAILAGLLQLLVIPYFGAPWLGTSMLVLQVFLAPALIATALAALLRESGTLGALASLAVAVLALAGFASALAVAALWESAFAAAEAGTAATADYKAGLLISIAVGWATGAAAIATGLQSALVCLGFSRVDRWAWAGLVAVLAAPVLALSLLSPTLGVLSGIVILSLLLNHRGHREQRGARSLPPIVAAEPVSGLGRAAAASLAWLGFAIGTMSVAFALTGSHWPGVALDGTQSMQWGIAGGFLSALMVVLALAGLAVVRYRELRARISLLVGISLLGLVIAAVTSLPLFDAASPIRWAGVLATVLCGAVFLATVAYWRIRGSRGMRSGVAVAIGAGYSVTVGFIVTFAVAFLAPITGLLLALWMSRGSRLDTAGALN